MSKNRRTNPKVLKMNKRKATFNAALFSLFHGNPIGQEGYFKTYGGRIIRTKDIPDPVSRRRQEVLNTLEEWQSDFFQGVSEYCFLKVVGPHYPDGLKRFFSGEKNFFVQTTNDCIRRSTVYPSKLIAMMAFDTGRILWVDRIDPPLALYLLPPAVRSG